LELRLLLVLVGHRAGELVPVLLDDQGGLSLLPADVVLALPRPDRVRFLVPRAQGAAEPEHQHRREDRLHGRPRDMTGGKQSDVDRPRPLTAIVRTRPQRYAGISAAGAPATRRRISTPGENGGNGARPSANARADQKSAWSTMR